MKVGLSTSVIQRGTSGISQYLFGLLRAFRSHAGKHRFVVFTLREDLPLFDSVQDVMTLVEVPERYRSPVRNILWHQLVLPKLVRQHQIDVLHVPSYRRLLWPKPCTLVSTICDLAQFRIRRKYDAQRMFYGRVMARHLAQRQDSIIAISNNTARDIIEFFKLPADRITVTHLGLDHQRFFRGCFAEAKDKAARRFGLLRPFFLYLARLEHPGKNHLRLIQAFDELKSQTGLPWDLVFAGIDWHGADLIHTSIQQARFSKHIRCLGFVPDADVPSLYQAADVFVYPSLYEGFGLPPLEAMACGCPVLCSDRGSLAEVVGDAAALVNPESVVSLKNQMLEVARDKNVRDRLASAGLKRARQFNWQTTAEATLHTYSRALQRRKRR